MESTSKKRIEFAASKRNKNHYVPSQWFLNDIEVTEMEYYGITKDTTLKDIGVEPADMAEYQEWQQKKAIIQERDGLSIHGINIIGF